MLPVARGLEVSVERTDHRTNISTQVEELMTQSFSTYLDAQETAAKLRANIGKEIVVKIMPAKYGKGFVVRQYPIDVLTEFDYRHVPSPADGRHSYG